ncbi:MAG: hypothetical protein ACOYXB_11885 [Bacteroidota bacterium]
MKIRILFPLFLLLPGLFTIARFNAPVLPEEEYLVVKPHTLLLPYQDEQRAIGRDRTTSDRVFEPGKRWSFLAMPGHEKSFLNAFLPGVDPGTGWQMVEISGQGRQTGDTVFNLINEFIFPEKKAGMEYFLRIGYLSAGAVIWLNGNRCGSAGPLYAPADFYITPFLQSGKNKLVLQCQDFIPGEVLLISKPALHVSDVRLQTHFSEANITLRTTVVIGSLRQGISWKPEIMVKLIDRSGMERGMFKKTIDMPLAYGQENSITADIVLSDPSLWSAGSPELYTVIVSLSEQPNRIREVFALDCGFREINYDGQGITVNGSREILRPDPNPPSRISKGYAAEMKDKGYNALRYSSGMDPAIPEVCDREGIYLLYEPGRAGSISEARIAWLQNHPSVLMMTPEEGTETAFPEKEALKLLNQTETDLPLLIPLIKEKNGNHAAADSVFLVFPGGRTEKVPAAGVIEIK